MRATEELRNDHGVLRGKLTLLEEVLPLAQAPHGSLRSLASSLARCLSCHAEKEELLLGLLDERLPPATRAAIRPLLLLLPLCNKKLRAKSAGQPSKP